MDSSGDNVSEERNVLFFGTRGFDEKSQESMSVDEGAELAGRQFFVSSFFSARKEGFWEDLMRNL